MKRKLLSLLVLAAATQAGAQVNDEMIAKDAATPDNVLSWGLGTQGQRYSPLSDINANSIKRLAPVWSMSFGGEKQRGQQSQPLVYDGVMYVTASYSRIYAFDTKTGKKLWKYEHRLPEGIMPCCDVINRGAALYGDLVIFGTLDAQLVALNRKTGKVAWREKIDDYSAGYSYTAAPLIAEGLLLTGVSGGEFGVVGRVEARDPKTGKMVWTRPMVEGHMGYKDGKENGITGSTNATWPGETWKTGGAATWLGGSYDATTGLAYFGTGNPGPWNSHVRKGDNLYSASTVAIDVKTGQIKWHYQSTPNDGWDYDGVNEFVTFDMDGKRVGAKADRNGFFYVNDATNGKLLNAFPFVTKTTWASSIDLQTGRPNFNPDGRPGDPTEAAAGESKGKSVFAAPGFLGGKNQMPMAYSPKENLVYIPAMTVPFGYMDDGKYTHQQGKWNVGIDTLATALPDGDAARKAVKAMMKGHLIAWDPVAQKARWTVEHPYFWNAGVLATAGYLVFQGSAEGVFAAYNAKNGTKVWSYKTHNGIIAAPSTYSIDGEQYIALMVGYGGAAPLAANVFLPDRSRLPGRLIVFKLGGTAKVPEQPLAEKMQIDLTGVTSKGSVTDGFALYHANCAVCHGASVSGTYLPDLKTSPMLLSAENWKSVVIDGARQPMGMISFKEYLTNDQSESIRAYVLSESAKAKAEMAKAK